jgi:hypothetical protein
VTHDEGYNQKMNKALALLADVANGIFATLIASHMTSIDPSWHFFVGIAFAMLPDLDALPLLKNGVNAATSEHPNDHREGLHFPLPFMICGVILISLAPFWGWLFLIATMLHFCNDLYGTGWGVPIFWPFSDRRYKLFGRRANLLKRILIDNGLWSKVTEDEKRLRLIVSWSEEELHTFISTYGIEDWVEKYYLRRNWISGIEYTLFLLAVLLVFLQFTA